MTPAEIHWRLHVLAELYMRVTRRSLRRAERAVAKLRATLPIRGVR